MYVSYTHLDVYKRQQVIQPRLLIVHIPSVPKRIRLPQRSSLASAGAHDFTPGIIAVFYYLRPVAVNDAYDIPLQILHISIPFPIVLHPVSYTHLSVVPLLCSKPQFHVR